MVYLANIVSRNRRPLGSDYRQPETGNYYPVFCGWQVSKNPTTGTEGELWLLSKIVANVAFWVMIGSSTTTGFETFTTNLGGPVTADVNGNVFDNASVSTFTDGTVLNTLKTEVQGTNHALFVGRGANVAATTLGVATNGQIPIGSTGLDPVLAAPTSGNNITFTLGAGSITANLTGTTNHAVQLGNASGSLTSSNLGLTHALFMGNTGVDPAFTLTGVPYASGISFDAGANTITSFVDANAANWTPTLSGSTGDGATTYTIQAGVYTKLNGMIMVQCQLSWTATTATGNIQVKGFPATFSYALSQYTAVALMANIALPAGGLYTVTNGINGTKTCLIQMCQTAGALLNVPMSAAGNIAFTMLYFGTIP